MMHYILVGKTPVGITGDQLIEWMQWTAAHHNLIKRTVFPPRKPLHKGHARMLAKVNDFRRQTITIRSRFLGLDHHFSRLMCEDYARSPDPILFETTVSGGPLDGFERRVRTMDEMLELHDWLATRLARR